MPIKIKKQITISAPEVPYSDMLISVNVSESADGGVIRRSISGRMTPYRIVNGNIEKRDDLSETFSWSDVSGKNQKIEKLFSDIEKAVQTVEA